MTRTDEIKKLIKVIRPHQVPYLYKYRSLDSSDAVKWLQDVFENRRVFLNDATKFNDPFECRPCLTIDGSPLARAEFLKELTKDRFPNATKGQVKKLMRGKTALLADKSRLEKAYSQFVATVGIYCLSEKKDNLLMWAHYSDSHRGLCLEFRASEEGSLFWEAFKVIYQDDYPVVNMMRIGEPEVFRKAVLTKSTLWAYEQEWRILKIEDEGGPGNYHFPSEALTGVIFGALMKSEDKEMVKDWLKTYPSAVSVYQASLNGKRYQIDLDQIA